MHISKRFKSGAALRPGGLRRKPALQALIRQRQWQLRQDITNHRGRGHKAAAALLLDDGEPKPNHRRGKGSKNKEENELGRIDFAEKAKMRLLGSKPTRRHDSETGENNEAPVLSRTHLRGRYKPPIFYTYPRTSSEARAFVQSFLQHKTCTIFTESNCPFSQNAMRFLVAVGVKFQAVELDCYANRQLITNYLFELCQHNPRARNAPVVLLSNYKFLSLYERAREPEKLKCLSIASADELGQAWADGTLTRFYQELADSERAPDRLRTAVIAVDRNDEGYANGTWGYWRWLEATRVLPLLRDSFGYIKTTPSNYTEPHPDVIIKWKKLVGKPVFTKDMGNPRRPKFK